MDTMHQHGKAREAMPVVNLKAVDSLPQKWAQAVSAGWQIVPCTVHSSAAPVVTLICCPCGTAAQCTQQLLCQSSHAAPVVTAIASCGVMQVETEFLPWLTQQALAHVEQEALARAVLQRIVADAVTAQVMPAQNLSGACRRTLVTKHVMKCMPQVLPEHFSRHFSCSLLEHLVGFYSC